MKANSLDKLKSIQSELKMKAKGISTKFDTVFKPFIDEQNGAVPKNDNLDLTSAYDLLSEEQQLIKAYSEKLSNWIEEESQ